MRGRVTFARAAASDAGDLSDHLAALQWFQNERRHVCGTPVVLAASDEIGIQGFDLFVERAHAEALRARLVEAGARVVAPEAVNVVRVESGVPEFGVDMDEDTIPLEAGIELRAISFTKGCYVGQEVIVRVRDRGHGGSGGRGGCGGRSRDDVRSGAREREHYCPPDVPTRSGHDRGPTGERRAC